MDKLYFDHVKALQHSYEQALATHGFDAVVIHSGLPKKRSEYDDQFFPLRPTPHFLHWVPVYDAGCFLVVTTGKKPTLFWPEVKDFWERPRAPESTAFLAEMIVHRSDAPEVPQGKRTAFIGENAAVGEKLGLVPNADALLRALDRLRIYKTPYEVACLAEANRRASLGHEAVRRAFAEGDHPELDLHLLYLKATRQDDHETPYKNIVALGRSASILHHIAYGKDATKAESLLVDAGAMCLGYCSDITRTWVRSKGAASQTFQGVIDAMEAMQKHLVGRVTLGMPYEDLHDESHRQLSAILKEAGIAKGSVDEIDGRGISRVFYPHGLGHSLGLQTHDVGCGLTMPRADNLFLRNTTEIAEDQVFTIEPGLYFVDTLLAELRTKPEGKLVDWNVVEALAPFGGIRIEDDIHVTSRGIRNMTREVLPTGGGRV